MIPPLLGLTVVLFILIRVGGDPVAHMVEPDATEEEVQLVREAYGFDKPFLEQYFTQFSLIIRGDFGDSLRFKEPAMPLVIDRLPATLELALASIVVALLIAAPAGILSAVYQNTWIDFLVTTSSTLGRAMPNFWIGIMLILVVGVQLRWLPPSGRLELVSIILPAITLGTSIATTLARVLRSSLLEVMRRDYMTTAHAKGLKKWTVILRHGLRNALIAVVTVCLLYTSDAADE